MNSFTDKYVLNNDSIVQLNCISDSLRNRIWNLFYQKDILADGLKSKRIKQSFTGKPLIENLLIDKLGLKIEQTVISAQNLKLRQIEDYLFNCDWNNVYDFINAHLSLLDADEKQERIKQYNEILQEENSGYRIVSGQVCPITDSNEIKSIENASNTKYDTVNLHISKAVSLCSAFEKHDYENSIKESISAVESICCIITGTNDTLSNAIKKLKDNGVHIHKAMEKALLSLYGYTSDESGIRHAGMDFVAASFEDAKFMLVICSAFINYLSEKWNKIK